MLFKEALDKGEFVITGEIGPPKGVEIEEVLNEAELIKDRVNAINVTDLQSSVMRLGSLPVCHMLTERGIEPIFQVTCRDRNRLALQSDLLSAYSLGIRNILILTGDYPTLGDHPQAKPVFDLDSIQLLEAVKTLESGHDMSGEEIKGNVKFFTGAVVNPGADPIEPEIIKMEKKVNAGAEFFQTQAIYDVKLFKKFIDRVKHLDVKILGGIVLLKSAGMARFMNKNVSGVSVPDDLIDEMDSVSLEDRVKKSIEIAARLIKEIKPLCCGIHLMPLGWDKHIPAVLDRAGL